jgi:hypothetical protein
MKAFLIVTFFIVPTLLIWILASYGWNQLAGGKSKLCGAGSGIVMVIGYTCFYKTMIGIRKERGDKEL